ncbi:50S ribosomal protein L11 methyltransferase [Propylenella binzhouense]|uniref:Ribosomal protein L11 methyltransferase n=1 Tax=Propylenella binzhouense TaxID=2555902 RepID=A0A964T2W4_9HYPH|nr:50S ribosomal protein L11 methyltransferase [Propylenella binzhouense]MYZ46937.1 50S ribosomal protein L11 methyltransferase [Propylenella binzhouense]
MILKATFTAPEPEARRIAACLEREFEDGAVPVALFEEPERRFTVDLYFEAGEPDAVAAMVGDRLAANGIAARPEVEVLPEADWIAEGLKALQPVEAGRFVIHGSHDRATVRPGRVAIEIEAGQAFGTGHHGTTAGCLAVLDRLTRARRFENPLDLGTGSGVLAIALAKVLRVPVLATDIDPVAIRVARENAALNRVAPLANFVAAGGMQHGAIRRRAPFDLIVANILAEPLMRLAPAIAGALAPNGVLVLSGLLRHQRERVVAAYALQGLRLDSARIFEGWAVLVLARRHARQE